VRDFLAARAVPGVESVDERGYVRVVSSSGGPSIVCVRALQQENALELRVRGAASADLFQISAAARRVFDLASDPTQIAACFAADDILAPLVERRPGLRIPGAWDPFECTVRAVLGQQVSVAAGRTLAARLVARVGEPIDDGDGLTHAFPGPAALASANLDGLGIMGARLAALRTLARAVLDGALDFSASADAFSARLASLPGFGPWTAQYVALRALGDPDAFPSGDLVLRRMAGNGVPLTTRELERRAEAWRPWRGYAVMHLWRAAAEASSAPPPQRSAGRT
jgi:AraC family transcriptional regulator of adaptative response / DNA-3-methyladenine glycosylase II